jgi:two-component system CheB/CheR fusion protein
VLKDNGYCHYMDEDAIGPLWKGKRFPLSACISGWAMLNKQSVVIPDIYQDARIPVEAYRPTFVKSLAMVPIRAEEPIGAIGNYWSENHEVTPAELEALQTLADTTSVAIENIELYASLKNRIQDLEKANRAKDEFLLIVSHELRTPLNSILGWSDVLAVDDLDPTEMRAGLDAIQRSAQAQFRVVDSLIEASSIVLGQFHLDKEDVDLLSVLRSKIERIRPSATAKLQELSLHADLTAAPVQGDPERLQKAIFNVLDNAIKFTPPGGRIDIRVLQQGPSLLVKVHDSGEGIDLAANPHIFDQFSQVEHHLTRRFGGLGLGLNVAKSIMQAHGGDIEVSSPGVGKGSEFILTMPMEGDQPRPKGFVPAEKGSSLH